MNQTRRNGDAGGNSRPDGPDAANSPPFPERDTAADAADADADAESADPAAATGGPVIAEQAARIAELEHELADTRLRALADLDNARKRCTAQIRQAEADTRAAVATQWLPVVDSLDLALAHAQADPASIIEGVHAVRDQALNVLAGLGFPRRDDRGTRFDPARHEAVASRPDPGAGADLVAEVIRPAYGEGDRQLRPAQVVVARPG